MNPDLMYATIPLIIGWVWWVDRKVSAHEAVIQRIDTLVQLMLEERLNAQSQNWREAEEPRHRRRRD